MADVVDLRLSSVDKKITPGEKRVRLCNYSDVYNNSVISSDMEYMEATATEREVRNCRLEVGDVIITKDSETPDDIGVPAVVREQIADLICGYHLAILRPLKPALDGEYLHYALLTSDAKGQFQRYANGITRFGLRAGDIGRVKVPLPSLPEQRKIAAILSSVDDAIEKTQAVIDQVQVVKRGLMQELLTRGLPGRHTRFKQTEIGEVPEDWSVMTVGAVAAPGGKSCVGGPFGSDLTRKDYMDSPGVPVIRGSNLSAPSPWLNEDEFVFVSDGKAKALQRNLAYPGDLIFTQRGTLGQVCRIPMQSRYGRYLLSQSQMRVSVDEGQVCPDFLLAYFRSPKALKLIEAMTIGTGVPHLTWIIHKKCGIPCTNGCFSPTLGVYKTTTHLERTPRWKLRKTPCRLQGSRARKSKPISTAAALPRTAVCCC